MIPKFSRNGPSLTDADLDELEKRSGVTLPTAYREFLLEHNGGLVTPDAIRVKGAAPLVQHFYAVGDGPFDLEKDWRTFCRPGSRRVPPELLPIAYCVGGDLLCLGLAGEYRDRIYLWEHEAEGDDTYTYDNLLLIAPSLYELLRSFER